MVFQHRANVLHEIELLVRGARPEVLPVVGEVVLLLFSLLVGEGHGTLLSEGRIGQHVVEALAGIGHERIVRRNGRRAVDLADVVQEHVHQAQPSRVGDDLVAVKRFVLQELLLRLVELEIVFVRDEVVSRQKESARPAGRVGDELARFGSNAFDHGADQGARSEVLTRPGLGVLGIFLKQSLVDVSLDIGAHGHPLGAVDHGDEAIQLCRVLDLVLGLGEDLAEHAGPGTEFAQQGDVVNLKFGASS